MKTQIFGQAIEPGNFRFDDGKASVQFRVQKLKRGWKVTGTAKGKLGRMEVYRSRAPQELLVNNWQSWGPFQKISAGMRFEGIEQVMKKYSRYVFTPIPETFLKNLVSDYFVAWEGNLAGFLSSRIAHPFFAIEGDELAGYLEFFGTDFEEEIPLEPFVALSGHPHAAASPKALAEAPDDSVESLLEEYAALSARENNVRMISWNPVGWSSWYQYFTKLHWEDIEKNLRIARRDFPFNVFQVDDGYQKDIGDWLEPKDGFRSVPELAKLITDHGFKAGIWTAPFSAAETTKLIEKHKSWMVEEAGKPKECYKNWGKKIFALDPTNKSVKNWLFETFSALKKMGFSYFKIDFLFAAALPGKRAKKVTPVQAYREGMRVIRQAVGESFVLGCGAPLLPTAGFVEGMRVGEDTAPFWDTRRSAFQGPNAYHALKNSVMRSFLHRRLWLNDPDCLLLRTKDIELDQNEKELCALAAGALDNMIIESDDLELVDEWGRNLLRRAISLKGGKVRVQGLLDDDIYVITSRGGPSGNIQLLANLSNQPKYYRSIAVPPHSAQIF